MNEGFGGKMKNRVKAFQLAIGVDLIGSKMSMASSRTVSLEATAIGIRMHSKNSNRTVVIPYSNVKGFELFPDFDEDEAETVVESEVLVQSETAALPKRRGRKPKTP